MSTSPTDALTQEHSAPRKKRKRRPLKKFLRDQFRLEGTSKQALFDLLFGAVMPVVCLVFDPIVFRDGMGFMGGAIFIQWQVLAHVFIAVEICVFLLWHLWRKNLGGWNAALGGAMIAGAMFALPLGLVLLPLSLLACMTLISLLGLTPLFTGFVFLRCGARALRRGKRYWPRPIALTAATLMCALLVGVPVSFHLKAEAVFDASIEDILSGDEERFELGVTRLEPWTPLINMNRMVFMSREINSDQTAALRRAFERLTDEDYDTLVIRFVD